MFSVEWQVLGLLTDLATGHQNTIHEATLPDFLKSLQHVLFGIATLSLPLTILNTSPLSMIQSSILLLMMKRGQQGMMKVKYVCKYYNNSPQA